MTALLIYLSFALVGFLAMYIAYKPQCDKYEQTLNFSYAILPLPYIYALYTLGSLTAFFLLDNTDFIETLTFWRVLVPLIFIPVMYVSCLIFSKQTAVFVIIACIALTVWMQPISDGNPYPELPVWTLRLIIIILASIFCLGGIINNFIPHTILIPHISILLGLSIMAFLGAAPVYTALCSAVLIGALIGYLNINFYEVKVEIDNAAAVAISYMVCSLILLNIGEFCLPSCFILTSVFWSELLVAVWRRLFVSHSGALAENTNCYLAAQNLTVNALTVNMLKICSIVMFIAWFQIYAINNHSLIIVSMCLTLWLSGSLSMPGGGKRTLKEINQDFIADIKQGINETMDILNKRHKDDE